jgi:hypothetical protein
MCSVNNYSVTFLCYIHKDEMGKNGLTKAPSYCFLYNLRMLYFAVLFAMLNKLSSIAPVSSKTAVVTV